MRHLELPILSLAILLGCATTRTTDQQLADQRITRRVRAELRSEKEIQNADIDVDTIDGVVYLRGTVAEGEDRIAALHAARRVPGVERVDDQLRVGTDSDVLDANPDVLITSLVEAKLASNTDTKARNIDVDTEDRVVTLSGIVETEQARRRAAQLANEIEGVRYVDNQLQVGSPVK